MSQTFLQALPTISNEDSGEQTKEVMTWCWLINFRSEASLRLAEGHPERKGDWMSKSMEKTDGFYSFR